jgi:antitoxin (DNA-binding transcriptional repressor) of toxin-antitoxin stability system
VAVSRGCVTFVSTFWPSDSYIFCHEQYSVAEAKNQLSRLIDQAVAGEDVVITRHGHPVTTLGAARPAANPRLREAPVAVFSPAIWRWRNSYCGAWTSTCGRRTPSTSPRPFD